MNRRKFIRLLGGGTIVATTAGLTACSSAFPDEAVMAWQGPGTEPDLRRWALGYAILSPNSHNRQPWLVDLREPDTIRLYVDRERMLPNTDPWFRQIVVSQGTFLEALVIALKERGVSPEVQLFPEGEFAPRAVDDRPIAKISWNPATAPVAKDPLFAQLLRRQTARVPYDMTKAIAPAIVEHLGGAVIDPAVRFGATLAADQVVALRELSLAASAVEFATPNTMLESLKLTRVGPGEIAHHRDGISVNGLMPRFAAALGLYDRSVAPTTDSVSYKKTMEQYGALCSSAMGFVWLSTDTGSNGRSGSTRSAEVNAGRSYLRLQLKATELGLQMHPLSQAPQEFPEMKVHYDRLHELLVRKAASEETIQMFCRIGYCPDQQHSPRRSLDSMLRA